MKSVEQVTQELKQSGYCVLPMFWSKTKCDDASGEIFKVNNQMPGLFEVGQGGDFRVHGFEKYSDAAKEFINDSFINSVAQEYSNCSWAQRVLAGVVQHAPGETIDSGAGWHVDSDQKAQFKALLYLTDVEAENGPYMFIPESKKIIHDIPKHDNMRITEQTIKETFSSDQIKEFVAPAGTCILADTTYAHRGKQIEAGTRASFTIYFYEPRK